MSHTVTIIRKFNFLSSSKSHNANTITGVLHFAKAPKFPFVTQSFITPSSNFSHYRSFSFQNFSKPPTHFPKSKKTNITHTTIPLLIINRKKNGFFQDPNKSTEQKLLEELKKNEAIYSGKTRVVHSAPKVIIILLYILLIISVAFAIVLLLFSDKSPIGRYRLINTNVERDEADGEDLALEMLGRYQSKGVIMDDNHQVVVRVKDIANEVINGAINAGAHRLNRVAWRVHVIVSNTQNAYVLPSGDIFVLTGVFPLAETEDGLAFIIAHEIAHVYARHGAEERSKHYFLARFNSMIGLYVPILGNFIANYLSKSADAFNYIKEIEADILGLLFMSYTRFDPRESISVCNRIAALDEKNRIICAERKKYLLNYQKEALEIRNVNRAALRLPPISNTKNLLFPPVEPRPIVISKPKVSSDSPKNETVLSSIKRLFG